MNYDNRAQMQPFPAESLGGGLQALGGGIMDFGKTILSLPGILGQGIKESLDVIKGSREHLGEIKKPKKDLSDENIVAQYAQYGDTPEFWDAIGLGASQNGITPTSKLPPLIGQFWDKISPERQAFIGQQDDVMKRLERMAPILNLLAQAPTIGQDSAVKPSLAHAAMPNQQIHPLSGDGGPAQGPPALNLNARMNPAQLAAYSSLLAGHVVDPRGQIVPPSLQSSRETPVEVNPGNTLVSKGGQPLYSAPGKPVKDNEELRKFEGVLHAAGIPADSAMGKQLYTEWAKKIASPAPGTQVTTNVNTEKKYGEVFSTKVAEMDQSLMDTAQKAPDFADRANRIIGVLNSGKVIAGTGAEFRLSLAKAMKLAGLAQGEGIEETETLVSDLSSNTLDAIKASGLGGGTGFSNADREFLEKAKGGKITMEAGSLKRLAELAYRAAQKSAERWNERVKRIPKSALEGTGIGTEPIKVPPLSIGGDADYQRLPSGTRFVGPDGKVRVKP